ncbi:MAG: alpha/beta fold hydrolase [Thermoleophilia bacterium]|nr:alpha/beta fold hydrolase [Thermoleophilia bacterium]
MTGTLLFLHEPPAAPDGPTLLLLHGRGGHEGDLVPVARAVAPGAGVLAPRAPLPEGGGFAWFRHHRIGVPVQASLDEEIGRVGGWLEAALAELGVRAPVVAVGFSNGGMMAGALAAARPDLVGGCVLLASAYPLPPATGALGGLAGAPVLALGGGADPFHPPEVMRAGVAAYAAAGARVSAHSDPGAGHEVTPAQAAVARDWIPGALSAIRVDAPAR